jgi:hypothetical protein
MLASVCAFRKIVRLYRMKCRFFRQLLFVAGILALLTACTAQPAGPTGPGLALIADADSVPVGQSFRVSLQAENIGGLIAAEAHLSFDPKTLEVVAVQEGDFVRPDFVVQNAFDNAAGTVDYAVAQINRPAAEGSGVLLTIEFRAKAAGTTHIRFRSIPAVPTGALLADSDGNAISIVLDEAIVKIAP